jgi:ATP-dependent Lon protease
MSTSDNTPTAAPDKTPDTKPETAETTETAEAITTAPAASSNETKPSEPTLPETLAVLPVRNTVVFPHAVMPMTVGRDKSKRLLQETLPTQKIIGVICQKNGEQEDPAPDELHTVGAAAAVLKLLRMPDGSQTVVIQGVARFRVVEFVQTEPFLKARIERLADTLDPANEKEIAALAHHVRNQAKDLIRKSDSIPDEAALMLENIDSPGGMTDFLAANLDIPVEDKQSLLETVSVEARLRRLADLVAKRLEMLNLSQKIHEQVRAGIDKTQREYYLREQLKAIQEELGQSDEKTEEVEELRKALKKAKLPEAVAKEAERELARMERIPTASPEYSVSRTYLELLSELPWAVSTKDRMDIKRAERILNEDHYDLEKVKKRILEYLAVRKLKKDGKGPILCFVGPPGVGKTSLGKSIARSLGRKFIRIALGGMHDESEIRGHRRTYIGSMPGRIIQEIRKAGSNNPVIMLDEIDKVGRDWRGDPASALLEVLDPSQNSTFTDHYLDVPFDLSKVMFIATANMMEPVAGPLADRMEVIEISGYTEDQKLHIARQYLLPRQTAENGLTAKQIQLDDTAILELIRHYTREAGVRNLERHIGAVCRAVAAKVARGEAKSAKVGREDIRPFLGPIQFESELADRTDMPGVATGLAWTPFGGEILFIESTAMPGKGGVALTGQLGDVMKESAQAAMSYLRSHSAELGIRPERLSKTDVHIHIPAGATPKDGPSAGVSMLTSLVSLLTGRPARRDVAMTGEITLRGLVLPIGGVKEKTLAAHRAGIRDVILPERNRKDLEEVPETVRKEMTFHFAEKVADVLAVAMPPKGKAPKPAAHSGGDGGDGRGAKTEKPAPKPAKERERPAARKAPPPPAPGKPPRPSVPRA